MWCSLARWSLSTSNFTVADVTAFAGDRGVSRLLADVCTDMKYATTPGLIAQKGLVTGSAATGNEHGQRWGLLLVSGLAPSRNSDLSAR